MILFFRLLMIVSLLAWHCISSSLVLCMTPHQACEGSDHEGCSSLHERIHRIGQHLEGESMAASHVDISMKDLSSAIQRRTAVMELSLSKYPTLLSLTMVVPGEVRVLIREHYELPLPFFLQTVHSIILRR